MFMRMVGVFLAGLFVFTFGCDGGMIDPPRTASSEKVAFLASGLEFQFPEAKTADIGDKQVRVEMEGLSNTARVGEPMLPFRTVRVLLPFGHRIDRVDVTTSGLTALPGTYRVEAARAQQPLSIPVVKAKPFKRVEIYESDRVFPRRPWELLSVQRFRGYQYAVINLYPVEYRPRSGKLSYHRSMWLKVHTVSEDPAVLSARAPRLMPRPIAADFEILKKRLDDHRAVESYQEAVRAARPATLGLWPGGTQYEYVVITSPELKPSFGVLVDHKISRGLTATVVTTDEIIANYDGTRPDGGSDDQTRIRNFIIDAYQNYGTKFVLLGGDSDKTAAGGEAGAQVVPHRSFYAYAYGYTDSDIPADIYYACLDGTHDNDADGIYGETSDGPGGGDIDMVAEVYVGRAPVDSIAEADHFVSKTIGYENSSHAYLNKVLLAGELLWSGDPDTYGGTYKDEIRYGSSVGGYTTAGLEAVDTLDIDTIYDKNGTWSASDIVAKLNAGVHVVNHLGHANVTYNMKFYTGTADTLTNTEHFILYSQGCYCGSFDNRSTTTSSGAGTTDSIAEHFLGQAHGGVAILMNARYGWGDPGGTLGSSQYLDREFFDAIIGESISNLGWANQDSKEDNIGRINQDAIRWCMYEMNLMGDPETRVKISMNHRPDADAGADQTVTEGGGSVTLDGSASSDSDGDSLTYNWTQTAGPAVNLSDPSAVQPAFDIPAVDCEEVLTFSLVVNDGQHDSTPDTVNVIVSDLEGNHKPVADAGADFSVDAGSSAALDGSGSADPDGDNIAYSWVQTAGPAVTLSNPAAAGPTFTAPDLNNRTDLVFELTVSDGLVDSLPDAVTVTIVPGPATLPFYEGFESGVLEAFWTATSSAATGRIQVTSANGPRQGSYHLTMDTSDSTNTVLNELVLDVDLSAAGSGGEVWLEFWHKEFSDEDNTMPDTFSGSSNSDGVAFSVDGVNWYKAQGLVTEDGISVNYLRFRVNLSALVAANGLTFSDHTKLKFQQYDNYPISTDGFAFDDIRVFEQGPNQAPAADAGADQTVNEGDQVNLDGSATADPDNWPDTLTYAWAQTAGTAVSLTGAGTATPSFTAPNIWNGDEVLTFELSACDGQDCGSDMVQVTVSDNIPNQSPVADAGADQTVEQGLSVQLDGSGSSDPDGGPQPLDFAWLQTAGPAVTLSDPLSATPSFQAPIVGADTHLTFDLEVCDGLDCSTDSVLVTVKPIPIASLPFVETFDSGSMSDFFKIGSQGRILVTSANAPRGGSGYHLTMDSPTDGTNALNEVILRVDLANLSGSDDVWLDFWHKEFSDEDNLMPDAFSGSSLSDGVAVSVDGSNWYKLQGLVTADGISSTYTRFMVNLSEEAAALGITLGAQTMIKFQQYDNYTIATDGFAFDDIKLYQQGPNQPPLADAGGDQAVDEGVLVNLDGSGSHDPDNWPDPISYGWSQTSGLAVTLSGADTATPTFTAPNIWNGDETLVFELSVCDGQDCAQDSVQVTITDSIPNQTPVADAGPDQTVYELSDVQLDASGSNDPDGGPQSLDFAWTQLQGPAVVLSDPAIAAPMFVAPDVDAQVTLEFSVEVCDGQDCASDAVLVTVDPVPGAALPFSEDFNSGAMSDFFDASSTGTGRILVTSANAPRGGSGYHLTMDSSTDGTSSLNELSLRVNLQNVSGDDVWLEFWHKEFYDEDNVMPDAFSGSSLSDGVAVSVDGTNWHKLQGLVTADGISSAYTRFRVNLTQAAAAKGIVLSSPTWIKFQQYDNYQIATDGFAFDDIRVFQQGPNQPPLADAGADQTVDENTLVALDGGASADPDNWPDPVTFTWTQTAGSLVTLNNTHTATPSFTAPYLWNGDETLTFQLSVCDGELCGADTVQVTITDSAPNQAPLADAGPDQNAEESQIVQLDASGSSDPDGGPQALEFTWTQTAGIPVTLSDPTIAAPTFEAPAVDGPQALEFQVEVCDGLDCASDPVVVNVGPIPTATLPFVEDFETGALADYWRVGGDSYADTRVDTTNTPNGTYHLLMDSTTDGYYALNELTLTVDLAGKTGVELKFHHKEYYDEDHAMPASFTGSYAADGVAISPDGINWYKAQGLTSVEGISTTYQQFVVDLDVLAANNGLTWTSSTRIRFQQYDNYGINTDGFAFDDIEITFACTPDCEGKQCGDDGCGGSCGTCDDGNDCTQDTCNESFQCEFAFAPAGTPCGAPDDGPCDAPDTCDGAGACQANFQPAGTTCRPAAGLCDLDETCTGSSADCPDDQVQPDTLVCRPAGGDCDLEENCDGISPLCPQDAFMPDTVVCRDASGVCDLAENCTGVTPDCPADAYLPSSITCRDAAGACDLSETCTGSSADCPPDGVQPGTLVCRPAAGDCDAEETCDGASVLCPPDTYLPDTAVCRAAAGGCDLAENCTGAAPDCPADAIKPASAVCRQSAGLCDVEEVCDGLSVDCPADAFAPDATVCRQSTQACDPEEVCTGSSAECPDDVNNCNDLPFEENFNDGQMSEYFEINSTNTGRILITDAYSPAGGDGYHLTMDSSTSYSDSLNELILTIDLAGVQLPSRVFLEFAHKEFSDEDDVMPDSFSGSDESDGVAISVDYGQTWYKVQGLTSADGVTSSYQTFTVDLTGAASRHGISLQAPTLVKFQQYDNYSISTDGFAFDDIKLYSLDPSQPPEADFSFAYAGFEVAFTDLSSDAYGSIVAWAWDFGDGQVSADQNPVHTYTTAGTYTVTLTVTDNDGQTDSLDLQVRVPQASYCDSQSDYANEEWIGKVQIGDFVNTSDGRNYSDFTDQTVTLTAGQTCAVELVPEYSGYAYSEYFRIWIDFNQDGDFDDAGELVFADWNNSAVTGDLTVPATAPAGTTRMRVSMKYNAYPDPCETFTYGEVEDYTVDLGQ